MAPGVNIVVLYVHGYVHDVNDEAVNVLNLVSQGVWGCNGEIKL